MGSRRSPTLRDCQLDVTDRVGTGRTFAACTSSRSLAGLERLTRFGRKPCLAPSSHQALKVRFVMWLRPAF